MTSLSLTQFTHPQRYTFISLRGFVLVDFITRLGAAAVGTVMVEVTVMR